MSFAWGIDPDADGFALAVVNAGTGGLLWHTRFELEGDYSDEARVAALYGALVDTMALPELDAFPPAVIAVEQPAGEHPKPKLMAGWAAATIAAVGVVAEGVVWMTPPSWQGKPAGVGILGNVLEEEAAELFDALQAARIDEVGRAYPKSHPLRKRTKIRALWVAKRAGYGGADDNEADAVCIALAAARRVNP